MKAPPLLLPGLALLLLPGCFAAAVGGGVVYATRDDSAEAHLDAGREEVFEYCRREVLRGGSVDSADPYKGEIKGTWRGSDVEIQVTQVTETTVKVEVSARKHLAEVSPDPDTAEKLADTVARHFHG
ncbi:MAG: hypothetical protein ACE5H3_12250 [Planctomycetota bacterium]